MLEAGRVSWISPSCGVPATLPALLIRRDFVARYRPTLLGPIWAFLQPVAATAVFSTFLGGLVGIPSDGTPYAALALLGVLPWSLFAG